MYLLCCSTRKLFHEGKVGLYFPTGDFLLLYVYWCSGKRVEMLIMFLLRDYAGNRSPLLLQHKKSAF